MLSRREYEQRIENGQRIAAERRALTHCKHGHEFSPENTIWRVDGRRRCYEENRVRSYRKRFEQQLLFESTFGRR